MSVRRLAAEAESALFDAARGAGHAGVSARNTIIEAHLWLVAVVSREYRCSVADRSDLIGEGHLGLLRAFDRFDATLGTRFATYARFWVQASMSAYLLRTHNALGSLARARADLKRRRLAAAEGHGGVDGVRDVSLDAPLPHDAGTTLHERLVGESPHPDVQLEHGQRSELVASAVAELVATFDARERIIFDGRFRHDDAASEPVGLDVVAERLRLSRPRVRQLEERVRLKLAKQLRDVLGAELERVG